MQKVAIIGVILLAILFRFFQLGALPPSPYWEEVALGYDAYSLLKTGKDHHGHAYPIVAFESFGDWKPGFYIYATVPSVMLFGLNVFAVRFPSAMSGIAIVLGVGVLSSLLFSGRKEHIEQQRPFKLWLPVLTMLVAAIEPWGIILSRGAWESNLATALTLWAIIMQLLTQRKHWQRYSLLWITLSFVLMSCAMYTYHAARVAAPLMAGAAFLYVHWRSLWQSVRTNAWRPLLHRFWIPVLVTLVLVAPLLLSITTNQVTNRFATTSIFSNIAIIEESNQLRDLSHNTLLSRLLYHRYLLFGREMVKSLLSNLDPGYLFIHGDSNPRHSVQNFGQLFPLSLPLLLLGLSVAYHRYRRQLLFGGVLLGLGLLPSLLVTGYPHAVRTMIIFPLWCLAIGLGLFQFIEYCFRHRRRAGIVLLSLFSVGFVAQLIGFWLVYSQVYPVLYASEWQYGYRQMIEQVNQLAKENPQNQVYITREQGRPAMYYWFYSQTDPAIVQTYEQSAPKDQGEFLQFGRFHFIDKPDQVSTSYGILAASPEFTADMGLENQPGAQVISDARGDSLWVIQAYEK